MFRFAVILLVAIIACASAFTTSRFQKFGSSAVVSRTSANMVPVEAVVEASNTFSQFSQLLAAEADFGGYAGPAGSLLLLGFLILTLAPPLATKDQD